MSLKKRVTAMAKKVPTNIEPTKMKTKNAAAWSTDTRVTPFSTKLSRVRYMTMATASFSTDSPKTSE